MSIRSQSGRASLQAPNYGQGSTCSSETANRILALQLQLEMEQKRRKDVERALIEYSEGIPNKLVVKESLMPISEQALRALDLQPPQHTTSRLPAKGLTSNTRCEEFVSDIRNVKVPAPPRVNISPDPPRREVRKAPLPREAAPQSRTSLATRFGRQRANELDVYLSRQRHEARMAALKAFEL